MILNRIISKVKRELDNIGFQHDDIAVDKISETVWVFKAYVGDKCYVVKHYNSDNYKEIISRYLMVEKFGISKIHFMVENMLVIYESIYDRIGYRFLEDKDFDNEDVVKGLARWCKKVSELEVGEEMKNYLLTKENRDTILNILSSSNNETLLYIYNNFDNIKLKLERVNRCFVNNRFSLDALVFCEKEKEVFGLDFDNFMIGNKYDAIKGFIDKFDDDCKQIFFDEYGDVSDEEIACSYIENLFKNLLENSGNKSFNYGLEEINDGKLLKLCKSLVEWC